MSLFEANIGVIIVTFRRPIQLEKTIYAVLAQGIPSAHIWVINNGASDDLHDFQSNENLQGINLIHTKNNIASAGGFSLGMGLVVKSGLDWVWLFNDDSRPISGSLDSILAHRVLLEQANRGMVKLANLNAKGKAILQNWKGRRVPSYIAVSNELIETDLITFDGCLISSNLIREIGTCDPDYFMGTYEFDFCLKARDRGFKIYTLPNGLIEDEKSGSVGGTPPWRQYYNTRNHLWLGLNRRSGQIVWAWLVRELKFIYAILRWEDQKILRLRLKALAAWHAIIGKRGKVLDPVNFLRP